MSVIGVARWCAAKSLPLVSGIRMPVRNDTSRRTLPGTPTTELVTGTVESERLPFYLVSALGTVH